MSRPDGWDALAERIAPHVSEEWGRQARDFGDQGWIRLILLVDAHYRLSSHGITEKVAMTMADLAGPREREREGWEAIQTSANERRVEIVTAMVDQSPDLLPEELLPLFARSIEPSPPG